MSPRPHLGQDRSAPPGAGALDRFTLGPHDPQTPRLRSAALALALAALALAAIPSAQGAPTCVVLEGAASCLESDGSTTCLDSDVLGATAPTTNDLCLHAWQGCVEDRVWSPTVDGAMYRATACAQPAPAEGGLCVTETIDHYPDPPYPWHQWQPLQSSQTCQGLEGTFGTSCLRHDLLVGTSPATNRLCFDSAGQVCASDTVWAPDADTSEYRAGGCAESEAAGSLCTEWAAEYRFYQGTSWSTWRRLSSVEACQGFDSHGMPCVTLVVGYPQGSTTTCDDPVVRAILDGDPIRLIGG